MSNWNRLLNWKGPGTRHQSCKFFKRFLKVIALTVIYHLVKFGDLMSCGSRDISKMHLVYTNIHHDVIDLVKHCIVKNTKTWISLERNITFKRNKKILSLCIRWHILRSYRFLAEVTFNEQAVYGYRSYFVDVDCRCPGNCHGAKVYVNYSLNRYIVDLQILLIFKQVLARKENILNYLVGDLAHFLTAYCIKQYESCKTNSRVIFN